MTFATKGSVLLFLALFSFLYIKAQTPTPSLPDPAPKREFRGVWVATVVNIDWPTSTKLTTEQQKNQLISLIEAHHETGLNAIILQVRPAADAFFGKSLEPWSQYLTGKQGKAPDPYYDPLELAITEAHKRGMELHAWFNPYRATFGSNYAAVAPDHITRTHPEWFFIYGGQKLFNPGIPEVRQYIVKVILNVVDNYDIDGVHMDDYFYPYKIAGQTINDADTFHQYGQGFSNISDWRRDNVNQLIKMLGDSIHKHKPYVKFGISPFGIWKNKSSDPEGSATAGGDSYYELYADGRKWIKEGWIDYINPQLYWPIAFRPARFDTLANWWSYNTYGRHLYIGQAAYRINERGNASFKLPWQMTEQLKLIRSNPRIQGSVFFSSTSLLHNPLGFTDSLRTHYYRYPALPPVMLWLDSVAPHTPQLLTAIAGHNQVSLKWQTPPLAKDREPVYGYVVYRFHEKDTVNTANPAHILHIQYDNSTTFTDYTAQQGTKYIYVVTAIDRLKNESEHSPPVTVITR